MRTTFSRFTSFERAFSIRGSRFRYIPAIAFFYSISIVLLSAGLLFGSNLQSESTPFELVQADAFTFRITANSPAVSCERVRTVTGQFEQFKIENESTIGTPGWPDLPVVSRTILIPPQGDVHLEILNHSYRTESGLAPLIAPPVDIDDITMGVPSAEYLASGGWFPANPVVVSEPAVIRGYRLLSIHTFPVQYNPVTGETRFNEKLEFSLEFAGVGVNEVANPSRIPPSAAVCRALESMVVNPPALPARDDILTGNYLYIVPNVNGVDGAIEPLIEWRRQMGHKVAVVHVAANANSATVNAEIEEAYQSDTPPEFVCLVGDAQGGQVNVVAASQTGDYNYSTLDGNDPLPDVAIGRISAATVDQLRSIVNKIVSYETTPYMQNTDWYRQAMVVAGHAGNGIGEVHLAHWVRMQLEEYGFDEVRGWYWNEDGEAQGNQPFLTDAFRWGISILHYRAFSHMNLLPLAVLTNLPNQEGRWPAVLAISCNTGNFVSDPNGDYQGIGMSEEFLRARGGGIGAIGTATGNTNVRFNNLVAAGVWKGVYQLRMYCLGWGLNQGKFEIWRTYHGFDDAYLNFMDWNNLMGDPGTSIWTDVPQRIEVVYPEGVAVSSNLVEVEVVDAADGNPVSDAQVCLYRTDDFQIVGQTDAEGKVYLKIPDGIESGTAKITVVKHNVYPYRGEIEFDAPAQRLAAQNWTIDDDNNGQSSGNDDGEINPGERIEISFQLVHPGQTAIHGALEIELTSLNQSANFVDNLIELEAAPDPGESIDLATIVEIDAMAIEGALIRLQFEIRSENETWFSIAEFPVAAPRIAIQNLIIDDDVLQPGEIKTLDIQIVNRGSLDLDPCAATLISENDAITVIDDYSTYPRVAVNSSRALNGSLFRVRAHPLAIPGTRCRIVLQVETEAGFRSETSFEMTLGEPGNGDPFGPDEYGYICFDSEDDGWTMAPEYDWIEINPRIEGRDFIGTIQNITDTGDNQDNSIVVNLPFDFQYFGIHYNQLTICSNGWAAFGDQHSIGNFRNQHMAQALAPKSMLAVWWDNLLTVANTSAIVTYNDRNNGRYIVEWSRMRRFVEAGQGADETFQLILFDPDIWVTNTGDGIIKYQYHTVTNQNLIAHNDIPYCTIGISSPDGLSGLEYTYWNTYTAGATQIANELAITFTTQSTTHTGVIEGVISDVETGEPITGAQVLTTGAFWAETDEEGFYRIDDILIGEDYAVTASALGWNDSTLTGFDVAEDETLRIDFNLLHPDIRLSVDRFERDIPVNRTIDTRLTIFNDGNGPLIWNSAPRVIQDDERPIWEHIESIEIGRIANDDRIEGGAFAADNFFLCGANGDNPNLVYKITRNGEFAGSFEQAGTSRYGYKDMAWDGSLFWASGEDTIYGFTTEGEVVSRLMGPQSPNSALTYDPEHGWIWASGITTSISAINLQGERVGRDIPRNNLRIYGLSYNPVDEAGKNLYIHTREAVTDRQMVYRVDPEEGNPEFFQLLNPPGPGTSVAAEISGLYDPHNWTYFCLQNVNPADGRDRLDIFQIAPRTDWMRTEPSSGVIAAGGNQEVRITLGAIDLPLMSLDGDLNIKHNAAFGRTSVPVTINILAGPGAPDDRQISLLTGWNLISLNITPRLNSVVELMSPIVENGALRMMKDGSGRFYNPGAGFNNIPHYDPSQGYLVYMNEPAVLSVDGVVIAPEEPLSLGTGWNMIAYYPREPVAVEVALSNLGETLIIAKNIAGRFYLPAYNFNSLGMLSEGNGYQIKVVEDVELIYSVGDRGDWVISNPIPSVHFTSGNRTGGSNHSLLLIGDSALAGYESGVFDAEGLCAGAGVFDARGLSGVAVWGDDPDTPEKEGFVSGESFSIKIWDGTTELPAECAVQQGELRWSPDGITVARIDNTAIPLTLELKEAYPNPFNSSARITFVLPSASPVRLAIFDLSGREISRLIEGNRSAGRHSLIWQGSNFPSGLYIIRLDAGGQVLMQKAALVK